MAFKQKYKHLKKAPKSPHFSKMISFWANSFPFFPDVNKLELLLEKIFTLDLAGRSGEEIIRLNSSVP